MVFSIAYFSTDVLLITPPEYDWETAIAESNNLSFYKSIPPYHNTIAHREPTT